MKRTLTVFLCSTYSDLTDERSQVLEAVRRLQLQHDSMEFFGARADLPIETCLAEVRRSDVLVVVVGHRYGNLVPDLEISFSEAEYREAHRLGKPCLVYLRDDDAPVLVKNVERDPNKLRLLEKWKETLQGRHTIARFTNAHQLAIQVAADLGRTVQALVEADRDRTEAARTIEGSGAAEIQALIGDAVQAGLPLPVVISTIRRSISQLLASAGHRRARVFLSHALADKPLVRRIGDGLRANGIDIWIDESDLTPGDSLTTRIERGLDAADFVAFFLSHASLNSRWARQELNAAISRQVSANRGAIVLPVLLEDIEIPALLRDVMYLDMRSGNVDVGIKQLVAAIHRHELERLEKSESPIYAEVGIQIPQGIGDWPDDRLFRFIEEILEPEAWVRANRDYENVSVREPEKAMRQDADEKIEEVARRHGFFEAWRRYMKSKGRTA